METGGRYFGQGDWIPACAGMTMQGAATFLSLPDGQEHHPLCV